LEKLFEGLRGVVDVGALEEVTMEANPATFDAAKARLFRELGVSRVSLGIQSFAPHVLETLGREHTREQAMESVAVLREAGIPQVNIDLMFSVPGQSDEDWRETLRQAVACGPDHVSAYNLTYEEDTAFFEMLKRGETEIREDVDATMFTEAHDFLTVEGFSHYETSNYARTGARSTHNEGYWGGEEYMGLGPSAVSTMDGVRSKNVADTAAYVARVGAHGHAVEELEELDPESWRIERVALGLRTEKGIDSAWLDEAGVARAKILVGEGLAEWREARLVLVGRGRALVDAVAAELL
jgi:oxygen-independent coproporphyrinogen-3 oxidase